MNTFWSKIGPKLVQNWSKIGPKLVQNWSKIGPKLVHPKSHNNITQRSDTHTDHVFYVFCQKLSLVVGQNTWNMSGSLYVSLDMSLDTYFEKCSKIHKIHKWCQETFRNSRQQCRVLGTMFGWGWKQFKQSIFHLRYTWSLTQMLPNLALRKKWYYINLKGKTQGKGEKQGPSVENKPFLWFKSKK